MYLEAAATEFFYSKDFTPDSGRFYRRTLATFQTWAATKGVRDVGDITTPLLRRYAADLKKRTHPRTGQPITGVSVFGYMNALRTFLNFCVREDWLDARVTSRLEMPRKEKKVIQVLGAQQIHLLFRGLEHSEMPDRDRAILCVLLDTGLRVSELCKLTLEDVHFHAHDAWLTVHGKGRKEREVPLGKKARLALHRYIYSLKLPRYGGHRYAWGVGPPRRSPHAEEQAAVSAGVPSGGDPAGAPERGAARPARPRAGHDRRDAAGRWLKRADLDAGTRGDGPTSDEQEERRRRRRENRSSREGRATLEQICKRLGRRAALRGTTSRIGS